MTKSLMLLPHRLIERATLRGNEYAWSTDDIPEVIEAVRLAGLLNIGGQLQFRIPDGGTCECYWVDVNTNKSVSPDLPWPERVEQTAAAAKLQFQMVLDQIDLIAEGRVAFREHMDEFEAKGGNLNDALCFVWHVKAEGETSEPA